MTETAQNNKRPAWVRWMHIAGIAYPAALWAFVASFYFLGAASYALATIGFIALTVGTLAFVGGWSRYLSTK